MDINITVDLNKSPNKKPLKLNNNNKINKEDNNNDNKKLDYNLSPLNCNIIIKNNINDDHDITTISKNNIEIKNEINFDNNKKYINNCNESIKRNNSLSSDISEVTIHDESNIINQDNQNNNKIKINDKKFLDIFMCCKFFILFLKLYITI